MIPNQGNVTGQADGETAAGAGPTGASVPWFMEYYGRAFMEYYDRAEPLVLCVDVTVIRSGVHRSPPSGG